MAPLAFEWTLVGARYDGRYMWHKLLDMVRGLTNAKQLGVISFPAATVSDSKICCYYRTVTVRARIPPEGDDECSTNGNILDL